MHISVLALRVLVEDWASKIWSANLLTILAELVVTISSTGVEHELGVITSSWSKLLLLIWSGVAMVTGLSTSVTLVVSLSVGRSFFLQMECSQHSQLAPFPQ